MSEGRYSFSLTTFSPSGKLVQIEHALTAVSQGITSVGIKATNGIVIATEKKIPTILIEEESLTKIYPICESIGMVYSGMGPDARVLVDKARKFVQEYKRIYAHDPSALTLVKEIAAIMQEYTQSGGVRPFGVSLLIAGYDESGPSLYQVDPSGSFFAWKATAIGKNMINAKTFLEKRFTPAMEIEDAVHTAILTLKEGLEGQLSESSLEIGIATLDNVVDKEGNSFKIGKFKRLSKLEIKDYLANIS